MLELDTIYNEDCLEGMKRIPDGSVDCIICDLPYGTTACKWDSVIPFEPLWEQYHRVAKSNAAIVLFAGEPFTSMLITSNLCEYRQKLTWLKTRPTNVFNAKKQFMNWTEDICVFYRSLPTFNPQMRTDGQFTGAKVQHCHHDRSAGMLGQTGEKAGYVHEGNGGSLGAATTGNFATEGETSAYDESEETLTFSDASTSAAVTAQGTFTPATYGTDTFDGGTPTAIDTTKFSGGSKANDTFSAGSLPSKASDTFDAGTVPTLATGKAITAVGTGTAAGQTFTGTQTTITVS